MAVAQHIILVAGGSGSRMGTATPKQFLDLHGRPVIVETLLQLQKAWSWDQMVLVLPANQFETWEHIAAQFKLPPLRLVAGGNTRFDSVYNGLKTLEAFDGDVAIHDGVRPFVTRELMQSLFGGLKNGVGVLPAVDLVDSIRTKGNATSPSRPVDRSAFVRVQTPQVFRLNELWSAYQQPFSPEFTDDASVFEANGGEMRWIPGDERNIKITHPQDLALAAYIAPQF